MTKASRNVELFYTWFFCHFLPTIFSICFTVYLRPLNGFFSLTFGELLHPLNGDLKNQIRNFEKQKKQILSAKCGILFNQTCLNEELHPTYTNIYVYIYAYIYI